MKGMIIGIIVVVILLVGGIFLFNSGGTETNTDVSSQVPAPGFEDVDERIVNNEPNDKSAPNTELTEPPRTNLLVEYTSSGYMPSTITINKGDSVTFTNAASRKTWPASNVHPTHTSYPGSSISKCGTSEQGSIFDACKGLNNGESYTFTFNEIGTWKYHDHLRSVERGTIIVQ